MTTRTRIAALAGATMMLANACAIPVGNPLNIPLVKGCTIYIAEPVRGDIKIPLSDSLGLGCTLGL